jgi:hypothetical protein
MRLLNKSSATITRFGEQIIGEFGDIETTQARTLTIKCNWQPLPTQSKGEIAAILPSGVRITDTLVLYTKTALKVDDESNGVTADEVNIDGVLYKVFVERNWNRYLRIKHYEYILTRKNKK